MFNFTKTLFFIFILLSTSLYSTIINVPGDQPTIQEGINVAVDADTVLVQPDTYFENIDYIGKNITVASLFLTTQDTTYISQTVISGQQYAGSVVIFESGEDSTAVLIGFTITNGYAPRGGGIYCANESNPNLTNLIVTENSCINRGAGIYFEYSNPTIEDVIIDNNTSGPYGGGIALLGSAASFLNLTVINNSASYGGGIYSGFECNPMFDDVIISNNTALHHGGGIHIWGGNLTFSNVVISENYAFTHGGGLNCGNNAILDLESVSVINNTAAEIGGGIYCYNSSINLSDVLISTNSCNGLGGGLYSDYQSIVSFSSDDRCNIYLNNVNNSSTRGLGNDIYSYETINVIVDTFTVMNPTEIHASPLENFTFDIQNSIQNQVNADLYVSPDGNNNNSGITINDPLKTIQYASSIILADSLNPHTIFLSDGVYSQTSNEEYFPISLPNYVSLIGTTEENVVLDAEELASVISLENVNNITISNMTLICGSAEYGGGIKCLNSTLSIDNLIIDSNIVTESGGGIFFSNSDVSITNVTCSHNRADGDGGGIFCGYSTSLSIDNVSFENNTAFHRGGAIYCIESSLNLLEVELLNNSGVNGGAIFIDQSNSTMVDIIVLNNHAESCGGGIYNEALSLDLSNVTVSGNSAGYLGGGMFISTESMTFNNIDRCNIYLNNVENRGIGSDMFSYVPVNVIVDTFTVMNPTDFHTSLIENFTFDILHCIQQNQVNSDLYVSPEGDNSNSGLSISEPLKTIQYACSIILADSLNPHTIFLSEGIYSPSTNGEFFPVSLPEYVSLIGQNEINVVLDAEEYAGVINLRDVGNTTISDMTIMNGLAVGGGGIYCQFSSPSLVNVTISGNSAYGSGGGIYCGKFSSLSLVNVTIANNTADYIGGGIVCNRSSPVLVNVTLANNTALWEQGGGGGIGCSRDAHPSLINCILWDNAPQEVYFEENNFPNSITISYSDIQGGEAGIVTNNNGTVYWLEGNIDSYPLFIGTGDYPFSLLEDSPCIDAGNPNPIYYDPEDPTNPGYALYPAMGTIINDMGAYGGPNAIGWPVVELDDNIIVQTPEVFLHQNYPNPFNPTTTISYQLLENSEVILSIYNIKGQLVKTLVNHIKQAGNHSAIWDGRDSDGKRVSSGIYFYKLKVGDYQKVRKMVLVK